MAINIGKPSAKKTSAEDAFLNGAKGESLGEEKQKAVAPEDDYLNKLRRFPLIIPEHLRRRIEDQAQRKNMSMRDYIVSVVEADLNRE